MKTVVILATGESLKDSEVMKVKNLRLKGYVDIVIAVSNAGIDKASWADALVSHDSKWWLAFPKAFEFAGRKFCARDIHGTEYIDTRKLMVSGGFNSGLLAMYVARDVYKVDRIILLGIDMQGSHYFGKYGKGTNGQLLQNTSLKLFEIHKKQFKQFSGCEVVNANIDSALDVFPKNQLCDIIEEWNLIQK